MTRLSGLAIAAVVALALGGCSDIVTGRAVSVFDDPFRVAGMAATDGPSGQRPDAAKPTRDVQGGNGGEDDELAAMAVSDIEAFWAAAYGDPLRGSFTPVGAVISWDSNGVNSAFCGDDTVGVVNSAFCPIDNTIGWDRGELLPRLRENFGDMAIAMVLAHEYGHSIQHQARLTTKDTPTPVSEQQADCFSGVYIRWVAEGKSGRFTLSTTDGLNKLLAAMISFRDPLPTEDDPQLRIDEHGSAFERISAFQSGFTDGIAACAAEIASRRGDVLVLPQNGSGDLPVSNQSVADVVEAMNMLFSPAGPPRLSFDAAPCADARPSDPVSYCPATDTISVDLPQLQKMGTSADDDPALAVGGNTAYSALMSRYMLSVEHEKGGFALDNAEAALRTACLTGVAAVKISMSARDLDEAVAGILTNGLAASDVNGESVPSGFSRIDAFRRGVLGDEDRCLHRYP